MQSALLWGPMQLARLQEGLNFVRVETSGPRDARDDFFGAPRARCRPHKTLPRGPARMHKNTDLR